ncbi:hypothetical protein J3Q64DRAFT_1679555 [Phycomyces blakesleeanus]|uniref:Sorting nexin MVP1 n=1 Tax=Phycomyces blakesleeanus TaxID=4837 RepID=A0ABR3AVL1_PHYBL
MNSLREHDDPLSSTFFDTTSSYLGSMNESQTVSSSLYAPQYDYDNDPWGSFGQSNHVANLSRAFTAPAIQPMEHHLDPSTLLNGIKLPDVYNKLFSSCQRSGRVSLVSLGKLINAGHLSAIETEKILQIVSSGQSFVSRQEFNLALVLVGCAQHDMDLSLENVNRHREGLPVAVLDLGLDEPKVPPLGLASNTPNLLHSAEQAPLPVQTSQPPAANPNPNPNPNPINTTNWFQQLEEVKVTIAPEREGFIFKHVNYIVESQKRSSIVLRRFSDFWWLMEVLVRRYPFRALPSLPPKKMGGRDGAFLERRRKGLSRFMNAIVRHPVLRADEVVARFLTEPAELAAWRKQNPPKLDEEYRRKGDSVQTDLTVIPEQLDEHIQKAKRRVGASIEHYINLCHLMERMVRRMHGQATDYVRYSIALNSLAESEHRYHASECINCQRVVKGYELVAKHMQCESSLLDNQVNVTADGVLENLKRFRDLLVSFRELDERKERLAGNQIEVLSKRIAGDRTKVNQHKGVPGLEAEVERLEESIRNNELQVHDQECRRQFIRHCIYGELIYLHKQQAFVSSLYRDYVRDMAQFSRQRAENWQSLENPILEMPTDVNLFD